MSYHCDNCPGSGRCARCQARQAQAQARHKARMAAVKIIERATRDAPSDLFLLAEDGITDQHAVSIAATGARPIMLTHGERVLAAMLILVEGGTVQQICNRLSLPVILQEDREEVKERR